MLKQILIKWKEKFVSLLKADLSPEKQAYAIALGLVLGIVPFFFGLNIYLSMFFAWRLKLNQVLLQLVSNAVYPLQILLFVPFMRLGVSMFCTDQIEFSNGFILSVFKNGFWSALQNLGVWNLYGVLVWLITAIPMVWLLRKCIKAFLINYRLKTVYE